MKRAADRSTAFKVRRAETAAAGWLRLYWHTRENNYRARGLYDKYTPHSGFVRYVIPNPLA